MDAAGIVVVGLGPAGLSLLSQQSGEFLDGRSPLIVRTERHPAAAELRERGVSFEALDPLYQRTRDFSRLYPRLADAVLEAARKQRATAPSTPLVYAVPGHPLLGEESVRLVLARAREEGIPVRVLPALSFVDVVAPALAAAGEVADFSQWQVIDGAVVETVRWDTAHPTLIFQVDDAMAASRVKLALMEEYPDDFEVCVVRHAGEPSAEAVVRVPLRELDRPAAGTYDHLTTVYVPALPEERKRPGFPEFVQLVATLRGPEGCPWDREQTYQSLKRYTIEEAYEVLEAIDSEDPDKLCDELGDLMLQVLMYAQLGREDGYFDIRDVMANTVEKLIRRHPHVFGDVSAEDADTVLKNWDAIKRQERPERTSVLDGVPKNLPALMKALEVSKRVVKVGFEWPDLDGVLAKLDEEVAELKDELATRSPERLKDELGDLLFTVVNLARWLKVDAEEALRQMVERFGRRFREVERLAAVEDRPLAELGIAELDRLWNLAKTVEG